MKYSVLFAALLAAITGQALAQETSSGDDDAVTCTSQEAGCDIVDGDTGSDDDSGDDQGDDDGGDGGDDEGGEGGDDEGGEGGDDEGGDGGDAD